MLAIARAETTISRKLSFDSGRFFTRLQAAGSRVTPAINERAMIQKELETDPSREIFKTKIGIMPKSAPLNRAYTYPLPDNFITIL